MASCVEDQICGCRAVGEPPADEDLTPTRSTCCKDKTREPDQEHGETSGADQSATASAPQTHNSPSKPLLIDFTTHNSRAPLSLSSTFPLNSPTQPLNSTAEQDPFLSPDSLEATSYAEGHAEGLADGLEQGRREGRLYGVERGFARFVEVGGWRGWSGILLAQRGGKTSFDEDGVEDGELTELLERLKVLVEEDGAVGRGGAEMGERLLRQLASLYEVTDLTTLSTKNDDKAVEEFEERWKRAKGKVKVLERLLGEGVGPKVEREAPSPDGKQRAMRLKSNGVEGETNIEDFGIGI